jgi:hypothetical protein
VYCFLMIVCLYLVFYPRQRRSINIQLTACVGLVMHSRKSTGRRKNPSTIHLCYCQQVLIVNFLKPDCTKSNVSSLLTLMCTGFNINDDVTHKYSELNKRDSFKTYNWHIFLLLSYCVIEHAAMRFLFEQKWIRTLKV